MERGKGLERWFGELGEGELEVGGWGIADSSRCVRKQGPFEGGTLYGCWGWDWGWDLGFVDWTVGIQEEVVELNEEEKEIEEAPAKMIKSKHTQADQVFFSESTRPSAARAHR
ncbi:hypothetical protein V1478_010117 [Vespula squamosa]|uniref:Uncharacterized protein n=1 Tax=Vespula squamosa TaxID=30214 RepID=A0ABD2AIT8_VESSQ